MRSIIKAFNAIRAAGKNTKAFTLVELSIVIVVIGLIIGGVVAGKDLVQAAKLHSDISKFKEYKMAYSMFMEQYNAVPGDMKNASSYWGAAGNGDGNKLIQGAEEYQSWMHLSLSKLISGTYNGTSEAPRLDITTIKSNILLMLAFGSNMWGLYPANSANSISTYNPPGGSINWNSGVTTAQGLAIDTKMDDGIPTRGKVTAFSSVTNDCIKQSDGTTDAAHASYTGIGIYNLAQPAQQCAITVWLHR